MLIKATDTGKTKKLLSHEDNSGPKSSKSANAKPKIAQPTR